MGVGTIFGVFLPISRKERLTELARPAPQAQFFGAATILVVDDEEMIRTLACGTLRKRGYEVLEASDGHSALRALAQAPVLPSLVLLDLAMPVMGGDELVPILSREYPNLKIIVSSGHPEEEARKGFPPGSVAGFLQKPYRILTLADQIARVLSTGDNKDVIEFPNCV